MYMCMYTMCKQCLWRAKEGATDLLRTGLSQMWVPGSPEDL